MCPRRLYQDILNQLKTMRFLYATPWCQLSCLESDTFLEKERVFFVLWIGPMVKHWRCLQTTWCTGIGQIRCNDSNDSDHTKGPVQGARNPWELVLGICVCFDPTSAAKSGRFRSPAPFCCSASVLSDPARNRWVASVITQADYRINNMNKHGLDFWIFGWWWVCSELRNLSTWVCSFHCVFWYTDHFTSFTFFTIVEVDVILQPWISNIKIQQHPSDVRVGCHRLPKLVGLANGNMTSDCLHLCGMSSKIIFGCALKQHA